MNLKNAVIPILITNIVLFMAQLLSHGWVTDMFKLVSADVLTRPWILITSMFLHGDGNHLLFNMFALIIFGPRVEERIGTKRFLYLYFGGGIIAGIAATFFYHAALGASGALMAVTGMAIILMPTMKIYFNFFIPMPLWMLGIVYVIMDVGRLFLPTGVAGAAHLAGLAVGLTYGLLLKDQKKKAHKRIQKKKHLSGDDMEEYMRSGRI